MGFDHGSIAADCHTDVPVLLWQHPSPVAMEYDPTHPVHLVPGSDARCSIGLCRRKCYSLIACGRRIHSFNNHEPNQKPYNPS